MAAPSTDRLLGLGPGLLLWSSLRSCLRSSGGGLWLSSRLLGWPGASSLSSRYLFKSLKGWQNGAKGQLLTLDLLEVFNSG